MLNDTYKLLASITVVRGLYNSQKNIYDVLCEFICDYINHEQSSFIRASELTEKLNDYYSFKLNESVIKTCLKRMNLKRENGIYDCREIKKGNVDIERELSEHKNRNNELFFHLFQFLEQKLERKLKEEEKNRYKTSFCDFLLQENTVNGESTDQLFHEFVLTIENNYELITTLKQIKEGVLLYEGIRFSGNLSEMGSWKTTLCLLLDTEVLFTIGGYNSSILKDQYNELGKYILEINKGCTAKNRKIKMMYFPESKKEIDDYFASAERIIRGFDCLDPTKEAMSQIVTNCKSPADVQNMRSLFYQELKKEGVELLEKDFYEDNEENKMYNLESPDVLKIYAKKFHDIEDNIYRSAANLSHINVLRRGSSNRGFENCGYIFLTATGRTLRLAYTSDFLKTGEVPLATSFDFLINHFWFKLNKGFGNNRTPRTLDMVVRSRYILASIINGKVSSKFDEYKGKYERNEISKEDFYAINEDLRKQMKRPEEVDKDTISDEIENIEKWDMSNMIEDQRRKEDEIKRAKAEIERLQTKLEESDKTQSNMNEELKQTKEDSEYEKQSLRSENQRILDELTETRKKNQELEESISANQREKERRQANRNKIVKMVILFLVFIGVVLYCYGRYVDSVWTRVISAIFECSALALGILKKFHVWDRK